MTIAPRRARRAVLLAGLLPNLAAVSAARGGSAAESHLRAPASVWQGQVFPMEYSIDADRTFNPAFGGNGMIWDPSPLSVEKWQGPERYDWGSGTGTRVGLAYHTRALARSSGTIRLNPSSEVIELTVPTSGFGFYQQREVQQFSVVSDAPAIEVRPLPEAPSGFTGAVGAFALASRVEPTAVSAGEPVTWTLELSGTGNWPDIVSLPARDVSKDFQVIQPKARRTLERGRLFDGRMAEDAVLIPPKAGTYALGPVSFVYFDPSDASYHTITTASSLVTVIGSTPAKPSEAVQAPSAAPPPSELPNGLSKTALLGQGDATAPFDDSAFELWMAAPLPILAVLWFGLALRKTWVGDPGRFQRAARRRIISALSQLRRADSPAPDAVRQWRHSAAILCGIDRAEPRAEEFLPASPEWSALWTESDRALYAAEGALPEDWPARAEAALKGKVPPPFDPGRIFTARNLIPWLACAALAVGLCSAMAEDARSFSLTASEYGRGDFASVERDCRARLQGDPLDWAARQDLSLALAQQNRWDEAVAYAAGAFVQQPDNAQVRAQFALACEKAGYVPETLAGFAAPGLRERAARLLSPSVWQRSMIATAWTAAFALAVLIGAGYGVVPGKWPARAAAGLLAASLIAAAASWEGWRAYGTAADIRAVVAWRPALMRSIPTEADSNQRTSLLPAGGAALTDKTFLSWENLSLSDGETGWVRKGEVVPLWRTP